mmetsp:Transcript_12335/g.33934  ORF Transcript_12335/g.33934 Transcript_12335/m.33934 type:complete len:378 (-) Transcript_12335:77-1210(-)
MFRHRVDQGVTCLLVFEEKRSNPRRPWCKVSHLHQQSGDASSRGTDKNERQDTGEEETPRTRLQPLRPTSNELHELDDLETDEHKQRTHLFHRPQRCPPHHRNEGCPCGADDIPETVGSVKTSVVLPKSYEKRRVHPNQVVHKDVTTPISYRVHVHQSSQSAVRPMARGAHRSAPEPERSAEGTHSNRLVVVTARHGSHDVRWDHGHHACGKDTGGHAARTLPRQKKDRERRDGPVPSGNHTADVIEAHGADHEVAIVGEVLLRVFWQVRPPALGNPPRSSRKVLHRLPNPHRTDLHPRVDRRPNWTTNGIPTHVVVPSEELVEAVFRKVFGCPKIEPRVKLMDDVPKRVYGVHAYTICLETSIANNQYPSEAQHQL